MRSPNQFHQLIQPLHSNIFVVDNAFWIMGLQRKGPFAQFFPAGGWIGIDRRLVVFEDGLAVDFDGDFAAFDDDMLGPPFVVLGGRHTDVHEAVETAGFDPIAVADVDLAFDAGAREAFFLVGGVEIDAAVGIGNRQDVDFQFEVFERLGIRHVKEMGGGTAGDKGALFDFPGVGIVDGRLPTLERLAVENGNKTFLSIGCVDRELASQRQDHGEDNEKALFHNIALQFFAR